MKPKVLLTHPLLKEAMDYLAEQTELELATSQDFLPHSELVQKIVDKEGLLCFLSDTIDQEVLDHAPALRAISNCAVGINNIDLKLARSRGIIVTNTPNILTEPTADLTMALILATTRRIVEADEFCRQGRFQGWRIDLFLGQGLQGKTLGIIGCGQIGQAVARRAQAFGLKIIYYNRHRLSPDREAALKADYRQLDTLLAEADIVSIHASLNPDSDHLITGDKLALMKRSAVLINVARGAIVDEKALAKALKTGQIWAAGLDVYEHEPQIEPDLLSLKNVVLLPHIGSATYETRLQMSLMAVNNLLEALAGKTPANLVKDS
ncbi:MAG TPA: D-glycerate dehydrogenase [Candidatus Saccharicenans sp.]|nr:D-glycerate dehydrogenase [Candidatus Saccharicenans sp.]HQO75489.1 D-glycerate dehydrogenase [Candidatus Saccharicenans sp.]HUM78551.1 D-glycerate dehydrogenase [Candidatus Saccharicenans sp.]